MTRLTLISCLAPLLTFSMPTGEIRAQDRTEGLHAQVGISSVEWQDADKDYIGTDDWLGRRIYDISRAERSFHAFIDRPVLGYIFVAGAGAGIIWYSNAYYDDNSEFVHPSQFLLTSSVHWLGYQQSTWFWDYLGASWIFGGLFQVLGVNAPLGKPLFWGGEPSTYDLGPLDVPKIFAGRRHTQLVSGAVLLTFPRIIRYLNRRWK